MRGQKIKLKCEYIDMTAFASSGGRQIPKLCMPLVENYLQITTHELKQTCCGKNSNHSFLWQHFFRCSFSPANGKYQAKDKQQPSK
jgi:hypothetical protein